MPYGPVDLQTVNMWRDLVAELCVCGLVERLSGGTRGAASGHLALRLIHAVPWGMNVCVWGEMGLVLVLASVTSCTSCSPPHPTHTHTHTHIIIINSCITPHIHTLPPPVPSVSKSLRQTRPLHPCKGRERGGENKARLCYYSCRG